jgi:hypothetical protein
MGERERERERATGDGGEGAGGRRVCGDQTISHSEKAKKQCITVCLPLN